MIDLLFTFIMFTYSHATCGRNGVNGVAALLNVMEVDKQDRGYASMISLET